MSLCLECGKKEARKKYCSVQCIKRAWYFRNTETKHSSILREKGFENTATGKGLIWEEWVAVKLGAKHLPFNNKGCDLDWNGKLVDVKSSSLYKRKNKRRKPVRGEQAGCWSFSRGKEKPCDFFFCVCLDNKGNAEKCFLIPNEVFPKRGIVMGHTTKYEEYRFPCEKEL